MGIQEHDEVLQEFLRDIQTRLLPDSQPLGQFFCPFFRREGGQGVVECGEIMDLSEN